MMSKCGRSTLCRKRNLQNMQEQHQVIIYTDGSCSGNPGPGGWGCVLLHPASGKELRLSGGAPDTTNNRMEITAAIEALKCLKRPVEAIIYSDSQYLINAFNKGWLNKWQHNGWQTSQKKPVENADLWQILLRTADRHNLTWSHVPGHRDVHFNEICDQLARAETDKQKQNARH